MNSTYLIGVLMYFPVWLILYIYRKDLRKEILLMGSLVAIVATFMEAFIWTKDWWKPTTITGTIVGIEDILFGFFVGGIIVSIYEEIFKDKLVKIRGKKNTHLKHFIIVILLSTFIGNFTFFYINIHSFYSSLFTMLIPTLVIYFYRKDLIILSLTSGVIITLISIPIYYIIFSFDPTAINFWIHKNISGIMLLNIPVEDLVWFFVTGMFISPLYEFWKGEKLETINKK
ncbi:hypothetical protein HYW72_00995 [Candidatus Nomurabacteria bacterium]|nr:hypothetical protein [Candidatus Nomurabacteria bacterium]